MAKSSNTIGWKSLAWNWRILSWRHIVDWSRQAQAHKTLWICDFLSKFFFSHKQTPAFPLLSIETKNIFMEIATQSRNTNSDNFINENFPLKFNWDFFLMEQYTIMRCIINETSLVIFISKCYDNWWFSLTQWWDVTTHWIAKLGADGIWSDVIISVSFVASIWKVICWIYLFV